MKNNRYVAPKYADAILTAHNYNLPTLLTRNDKDLYKLLEDHGFCWSEEKQTWLPGPDKNGLETLKAKRKQKAEEWLSFPVTIGCYFHHQGTGLTLDTKISRGLLYFMAFRARVNRTFNCGAFMSILYGWNNDSEDKSYTQAEFDQIMERIRYGTHDYPDDITDCAIIAGLTWHDGPTWAEGIYGHTELTAIWVDDRMTMRETYPLSSEHHRLTMKREKGCKNGHKMISSSNGPEISLKSPLKKV